MLIATTETKESLDSQEIEWDYEKESYEEIIKRNPMGFFDIRTYNIRVMEGGQSDNIPDHFSAVFLCFKCTKGGFSYMNREYCHGRAIDNNKSFIKGKAKDLFRITRQLYSLLQVTKDIEEDISVVLSRLKLNLVGSTDLHLTTEQLRLLMDGIEQKKKICNVKKENTSIFDSQDTDWFLPLSLRDISPYIASCDVYVKPEYDDFRGFCPIVIEAHLYKNQNTFEKENTNEKKESPNALKDALSNLYPYGWEENPYLFIGITSSFTFIPLSFEFVKELMGIVLGRKGCGNLDH